MKKIRVIILSCAVPLVGSPFAGSQPLDLTIKGQSRDRIEIERVAPEPTVEMKDVIPFSRLGQTDWILSEELGYIGEEQQISMMNVRSPKAYQPSMVEFPRPPYFVQTYPPPPTPLIVDRRPDAPPPPGEQERWTFLVIDQNNQLLKKVEGSTPPVEPIRWDGMTRGKFVLRTDEIYSSMLIIEETPGKARTIVGEPIWMPALRYLEDNKIVFEFSNKRVYNTRAAEFSPALTVLVDQLMNELRKYQGSPFEIVIFDRDLELAQQRVGLWREALEKNLLMKADGFKIRVAMPSDRGEVTRVALAITK